MALHWVYWGSLTTCAFYMLVMGSWKLVCTTCLFSWILVRASPACLSMGCLSMYGIPCDWRGDYCLAEYTVGVIVGSG